MMGIVYIVLEIYPGARFAKDVSIFIIWPEDTHRRDWGSIIAFTLGHVLPKMSV
jgi:hypothetical protein